jgi:hypothetical protein
MEDMKFMQAMLAEMNANQKKVEANTKANCEALKQMMDANTKTNQEKMLARMDANTKAMQEKMDRHQVKTEAWIADMKDGRKEIMACQEMMEAGLECEKQPQWTCNAKHSIGGSLRKMP